MKQYSKTHTSQGALDAHVRNIKNRHGTCTVKGLTVDYSFPTSKKNSSRNTAEILTKAVARSGKAKPQRQKEKLYDTEDKKLRNLNKAGRMITFKDKFKNMNNGLSQIVVAKLEKDKAGRARILGAWGRETSWFNTIKDLLDAVDWKWMDRAHGADPQYHKYDSM